MMTPDEHHKYAEDILRRADSTSAGAAERLIAVAGVHALLSLRTPGIHWSPSSQEEHRISETLDLSAPDPLAGSDAGAGSSSLLSAARLPGPQWLQMNAALSRALDALGAAKGRLGDGSLDEAISSVQEALLIVPGSPGDEPR